MLAKVNADRFTRLTSKYEIDGFPTLKLFMHGVPMDYYGPRKAELLVRYLKKFVAPDVSSLTSDAAINDFVETAGTSFPIFIGFGLDESVISKLGAKYKKKAWFAVAKDYSEDIMVLYDFDKVPAVVVHHPSYDEKSVFYGPFDDDFLEDFVKQNLIPSAVPINRETLKALKDDERKIVLTIMGNETEEKSKDLIKLLRAAASANRDLVFAYVGITQWEEFADSFRASKGTKLPKMVVWDGDEGYLSVIGSESIDEDDQGSQISRFLEGYREGRTEQKRIKGPSLLGYINSLIGVRSIYIIMFLLAMLMLIRSIGEEPPLRVGTRRQAAHTTTSEAESSDETSGDKED